MRPTGMVHVGHLVGALDNWASLQAEYDCFYFVADWHALTSGYADTSDLVSNANTTMNQTGQAIEGIAIIMGVYLTISLSISAFMNWYNARISLR